MPESPPNSNNGPGEQDGHVGILSGLARLASLQTRLFFSDVKRSSRRIGWSLLLALVSAVLLLSGVFTLIVAAGWWTAELTGWPYSASFALAAAGGLLVAVIVAAVAWVIRPSGELFEFRSKRQFEENLQWAKQLLRPDANSGTEPRSPAPR